MFCERYAELLDEYTLCAVGGLLSKICGRRTAAWRAGEKLTPTSPLLSVFEIGCRWFAAMTTDVLSHLST